MTHYNLTLPVSEQHVRKLKAGDTVTLFGTLIGIRDATQIAIFDKGRTTRFNLNGVAVIHTAPNVRKVPVSPEHPVGYQPVCIGTTTSARMDRFTRPLLEKLGVRLILGKGGLSASSQKAFIEFGGAYLCVIGGAAAQETQWIEKIEDVDLDDLNPESLWQFRINSFGPLLVGMDSHGGNLYDEISQHVSKQRAIALSYVGVSE